ERIAHTVKGVAGNLGMKPLHAASERLERALKNGDSDTDAALSAFGSLVERQAAAIRTALGVTAPVAAPAPAPVPIDKPAATAAGARLRRRLQAGDGEAVDAFAGVAAALGGTAARRGLSDLDSAIGDFDFEKALATLDALARECDVREETA